MKFGLKHHHTTARVIIFAAIVAFVITSLKAVDVALARSPEAPTAAAHERLVSVYDRGQEKTILTGATTVRQALAAAGVTIDEGHDVVEPGLNTELVSTKYSINIYRARPVTIADGLRRVRITTAHQTPELIAQAAGVVLHPEDAVSMQPPEDLLRDGVDIIMTITRAQLVRLSLFGTVAEVRTRATTIGDLLREKKVKLQSQDVVSLPLDHPVVAGMQIEVWRNGKQMTTVEEVVAPPVERIEDANRPSSHKEIKEPGEAGRRRVTYEIDMLNGKELSRREVAVLILQEPKKRVEVVGVKPDVMPYTGGGNKDQWLAASQIPRDQWGYADWLVKKESGWNPNARNRSSGACGLAQALPCSKVPGNPHDPVNSLNWMHGYVMRRYGSWANAVQHSKARGWY